MVQTLVYRIQFIELIIIQTQQNKWLVVLILALLLTVEINRPVKKDVKRENKLYPACLFFFFWKMVIVTRMLPWMIVILIF
jgi:hypothetical protein